jgi:hypothetical protein
MTRARAGRFRPIVDTLEERLTPSVSFAPQQTFAVGANPVSVAVADLNGDGRPDVVVANSGSNTVAVLLDATAPKAGVPGFAAQADFATGGTPFSVAVADFNGDGKPDLAVANFADNTVSVLLNTTPQGASVPSFAPQKTFAVGTNPQALAVGDFNQDGKPDLVVANLKSGNDSVLLNTTPAGAATPAFAAQQTFAVGNNPIFVAVGDFNGDGKPDLAVSNFTDKTVSVLLDTTAAMSTTAAFTAQQTFAVGTGPLGAAIGDFNGDNKPDLVVADSKDTTVSVLLDTTTTGALTPTFAAQQTFAVGGNPQGLAVGDFDGDGKPDLAVGNFTDKTLSVLLDTTANGASTPTFATQQTFATGTNPVAVAVGDFNGDGQQHLVVADNGDKTVSVLLNTTIPEPPAPLVVGQFGSQGVWEYKRSLGTWTQLTPANATLLTADTQGNVTAEFPGFGVWQYTPGTGWKQLTVANASLLAAGASGVAFGEFSNYGVWQFTPATGWKQLTVANASLLAADAQGNLAAEFGGYGVWQYTPGPGWKQLTTVDASLLTAGASGVVFGEFVGAGVWRFTPGTGWKQLTTVDASALAGDVSGDVLGDFPGAGVWEYLPATGWKQLTAADASRLGGAKGVVYGEFLGAGVWVLDGTWGWFPLSAVDAALLAVA